MGFKKVMKNVGKVALKVAPYAAMAIPGVGIPLGMAIAGASSAADKKLSGGSWKQALMSGGMSAGLAGVGGGALKGIGPSSSALAKFGAGAAGKTAGTGFKGALGAVAGNVGRSALENKIGSDLPSQGGITGHGKGGTVSGWGDAITSSIGKVAQSRGNTKPGSDGARTSASTFQPAARTAPPAGEVMPRGGYRYNDNPMNQLDQSNPNLAQSIFQGRQEAIKNQPFRKGYNITTNFGEPDEEGKFPETRVTRMPKIYATGGRRGR